MITIKYDIPVKTVSEANIQCHWAVRARRAKDQRRAAFLVSVSALRQNWAHMSGFKRIKITLTRYGKRTLDSDNLAGSQKHTRDGIADALQMNDGDERLEWIYRQEKSGEYSVGVEIRIS